MVSIIYNLLPDTNYGVFLFFTINAAIGMYTGLGPFFSDTQLLLALQLAMPTLPGMVIVGTLNSFILWDFYDRVFEENEQPLSAFLAAHGDVNLIHPCMGFLHTFKVPDSDISFLDSYNLQHAFGKHVYEVMSTYAHFTFDYNYYFFNNLIFS
jgi:hypothetical protein